WGDTCGGRPGTPHLVQIAFDDPEAADTLLGQLRSGHAEVLTEVQDACVVQRDASGRVHLKQAIGSGLRHALHSEFWRRLIDHIPRYGSRPPPSDRTPGLGLECAFAREVAANLKPNTSLLLLLLRTSEPRALLDVLGRHRGRVLQCDLAGTVCQTLASALAGPPASFPSAAELREMVIKADEERLLARRRR